MPSESSVCPGVPPREAGAARGKFYGQATKGARGMPWQEQAMKDVASCEKPRRAASKLGAGDVRMGEPGGSELPPPPPETIGRRGEPGEVNHLSTRRKRKQQ